MKYNRIKFFLLLLSLITFACSEDPGDSMLNEKFIETETNLIMLDTLSVNLSTIIMDTVATNATGKIFVGSYNDEQFGKLNSESYFQLGLPDWYSIHEDETFDSVKLVLSYNREYFGDTSAVQKLFIHQLNENIEYNEDDDYIISSSTTFNFNPTPIGSYTYYPEPKNSPDTISIKINDEIGADLFQKLKDNANEISDDEHFIDYFHGLVIRSDQNFPGAVIGFKAKESNVRLIIYSTLEAEVKEEKSFEFLLDNVVKQFNNITHDFSNVSLSGLSDQRNELKSGETNGLAYLQGGLGLAIRVDFPSLKEVLLFEQGTVMEAKLNIAPLQNSYELFPLPTAMTAYNSDNLNRFNEIIYNDAAPVGAKLFNDDLYSADTYYEFDITQYINSELSDGYVDPEKGIIISLYPNQIEGSLHRWIADSQSKNTRLKIYYLKY